MTNPAFAENDLVTNQNGDGAFTYAIGPLTATVTKVAEDEWTMALDGKTSHHPRKRDAKDEAVSQMLAILNGDPTAPDPDSNSSSASLPPEENTSSNKLTVRQNENFQFGTVNHEDGQVALTVHVASGEELVRKRAYANTKQASNAAQRLMAHLSKGGSLNPKHWSPMAG